MLSEFTIWPAVFEHEDEIAIGLELLDILFNLFGEIIIISSLMNFVPNRISIAKVTLTRSSDLTWKSSVVTCPSRF